MQNVKITQCSSSTYWYKHLVGMTMAATKTSCFWRVDFSKSPAKYIILNDAEPVVPELPTTLF